MSEQADPAATAPGLKAGRAAKRAAAPRRVLPVIELVTLAAFLLLPLALELTLDNTYYLTGLATRMLLLAIFAISFDLCWGYSGIMAFGQGMFFGAAGYVVGLLGRDAELAQLVVTVPIAILVSLIFAGLIAWFLLLGKRAPTIIFVAMGTLTASYAAERLAGGWTYIGAANGLSSIEIMMLGGLEFFDGEYKFYYLALAFLVAVYALCRLVVKSQFGLVLAGIREKRGAARLLRLPGAGLQGGDLHLRRRRGRPVGRALQLSRGLCRHRHAGHPDLHHGRALFFRRRHRHPDRAGDRRRRGGGRDQLAGRRGGDPQLLAVDPGPAAAGGDRLSADRPAGLPGQPPRAGRLLRPAAEAGRVNAMALLEVRDVGKTFGGLKALEGVSVDVQANTFHGLIGPNGSGKSTLLKAIAGAHFASSGTITFDGAEITRAEPYERARAGLSLKFQITAVLPALSVYDNVLIVLQTRNSIWQLIRSRSRGEMHDRVMEALQRFRLADQADMLAGELSHGQQQWLEIAMALAPQPKLLLLDEPTGGMSPEERRVTGELLQPIREWCALVIVEHDLDFIKDICDHLTVLQQGQVLQSGTVAEIERSEKVQEVYTTRV